MTTLDKIRIAVDEIQDRLRRGEKVSKEDLEICASYFKIFGGKAGNAGKRKIIKTGK